MAANDFDLSQLGNYDFGYQAPSTQDYQYMPQEFDLGQIGNYNFGDNTGGNQATDFDLSQIPQDNPLIDGYQLPSDWDNFWNSNFGKFAQTVANFTPIGRAINVGKGIANFASNPSVKSGLQLGGSIVGGAPGAVMGIAGSKDPAAALAGTAGSMVGGPAVGQVAGNMFAGATRGMPGAGQNYGSTPEKGGMFDNLDFGAIANGLGGLYAASQANKGLGGAGGMNSAVQTQINNLSSMFGPDSPYAAQLRQQLERRDAAAGRRSQYGPREVELQAALAGKANEAARTIGSLAQTGQANQIALADRRNQIRGQTLSMLMNMGQKSGLFGGLNNMFKTNPAMTNIYTPPEYNYDLSGTPQ